MIPPPSCRNKYLMLKPVDHIPMILPQLTGSIVFRQPGVRSSSRHAAGMQQQACSKPLRGSLPAQENPFNINKA